MIARSWSARATPEKASEYAAFFRDRLVPELSQIAGHMGSLVLSKPNAELVEVVVLTFWESMEAVRRFAGDPPDRAVIEPNAQALLASFDTSVEHLTVATSQGVFVGASMRAVTS
jgi:heme-degrading monooxygenase HmoA